MAELAIWQMSSFSDAKRHHQLQTTSQPRFAVTMSWRQSLCHGNSSVPVTRNVVINFKRHYSIVLTEQWRYHIVMCLLLPSVLSLKELMCHRFHMRVRDLQISCSDLTRWVYMMTSPNGNILRITGPLWCGEFTGEWWIPLTKASDAELWYFLWSLK